MEFIEWTLDQLLEGVGVGLLHFTYLLQETGKVPDMSGRGQGKSYLDEPSHTLEDVYSIREPALDNVQGLLQHGRACSQ